MTKVNLRHYFEDKIKNLREFILVQQKLRDKARNLQAKEYERRLTVLNHAHEQNLERNAEFVSKDKFESFRQEFQEYKETTDKARQLSLGSALGMNRTIAVIVGAFSFLFILLSIIGLVIGFIVFYRASPASSPPAPSPSALIVPPK